VFTFATPVSLVVTQDIDVILTAWVNHPSDTYNLNDTLSKTAKYGFVPPVPVAIGQTINFGETATPDCHISL
jgi:hypothetical protein